MALLTIEVEFMLSSTQQKRGRTSSCDTYAAECSDIEDSEPDNRNPSDFSKRQKRLYVNPFICPPKKLDSEFDDYLFLDCADKRIRPLSRKTLQMDLRSFFNLCTVQFGSPREIKSLNFRTSDGTTCSAYRDGNDGQWQHLLGFLDVDEHSWIRVSIGDDHDDDLALEIWFQWLDPSKMPEVSVSRFISSHDNLPIIH